MPLKSTRKLVVRMVSSPNSSSELPHRRWIGGVTEVNWGRVLFSSPIIRYRKARCALPSMLNAHVSVQWETMSPLMSHSCTEFQQSFQEVGWVDEREKNKNGDSPADGPSIPCPSYALLTVVIHILVCFVDYFFRNDFLWTLLATHLRVYMCAQPRWYL